MQGKRRCRLHGGKSTGPKTMAGIHRIREAHWKDGSRSVRLQAELHAYLAAHPEDRSSSHPCVVRTVRYVAISPGGPPKGVGGMKRFVLDRSHY